MLIFLFILRPLLEKFVTPKNRILFWFIAIGMSIGGFGGIEWMTATHPDAIQFSILLLVLMVWGFLSCFKLFFLDYEFHNLRCPACGELDALELVKVGDVVDKLDVRSTETVSEKVGSSETWSGLAHIAHTDIYQDRKIEHLTQLTTRTDRYRCKFCGHCVDRFEFHHDKIY